jgi:3-phenylpropionate/trans-cinnamate dioxygenase ferredoxin reductase subunit
MPSAGHVIVGAGLAGAKAAEALRAEGFEGPIVLIGDEPEAPYERPPLSKAFLRGELPREDTRVHPESWYSDHQVELCRGLVVDVDTAARAVELDDGTLIGYERLLLAPGAEPRPLPIPGSELDGVHYLRTLADSALLGRRLDAGGRAVVIGAGWIGAEVAASARQRGLDVSLIERGRAPLELVLGSELACFFGELHRDRGVALHTGQTVVRLEGTGAVEAVVLGDGRRIECDFVVVGIGVRPRTELAERAGLAVQDGIRVDERLETSVPGVFAAGDVASVMHPFYGRRVRVEHWANALHQPEVAARAMLGKPAVWDRLPYFFSDQYELGMEYTGLADGAERVVLRGDRPGREFIAFWLDGANRVLAGMNVNVWDVVDPIADLIRSRAAVDLDRLADADIPLEALGASRVR